MLLAALSIAISSSSIHVELSKEDESLRPAFEKYSSDAEKRITGFFATPYQKSVTVKVLPSRKAFDEAVFKRWKMEPTQPWMVGAAGSDVLFVLSPRVWKSEAQEHNPDDSKEISEIVCHELVHSYHTQLNPQRELEGLEPMAWFVEGLATYVSGQLESRHKRVALREIIEGRAPGSLEKAWSGRGRYGVAGSMVRFVDERFGRKKVIELLKKTTNEAAMVTLGTTEAQFLADWRGWVEMEKFGR
jgi:hypothetical protein